MQAGSQEAEWARLRAAAASGEDGPTEEHLSPDKRSALARRGSDGAARDESGDRSADRSGRDGSGSQGMSRGAVAGALEAGPLHTPSGDGVGAATQEPAGAAGGGGGGGAYMVAVGSRDGLNTLAPLKGAAGAAVALAQAAARLEARLQRACHANPALSMAQVAVLLLAPCLKIYPCNMVKVQWCIVKEGEVCLHSQQLGYSAMLGRVRRAGSHSCQAAHG